MAFIKGLKFTTKGGEGSGWFAPPEGTHVGEGGNAPSSSAVLPDTFSTPQAAGVKEKADRGLEYIASAYGMTSDQYRVEYEKLLQDELAASEIKVRVSEKVLGKVIETGELKNTFDTGVSSSEYKENGVRYKEYLEARSDAEERLFGIERDASGSQRPISGFFEKTEGRTASWTESYGDVTIVLKDSVKSRTTFTDSDSLDFSHRLIPSPVLDPSIYSSVYLTNFGDPLAMIKKGIDASVYSEAQIFGGIKLRDIKRIHFDKPPSTVTTKKLSKAGIPWSTKS